MNLFVALGDKEIEELAANFGSGQHKLNVKSRRGVREVNRLEAGNVSSILTFRMA